jgi:hypothetical protein
MGQLQSSPIRGKRNNPTNSRQNALSARLVVAALEYLLASGKLKSFTSKSGSSLYKAR